MLPASEKSIDRGLTQAGYPSVRRRSLYGANPFIFGVFSRASEQKFRGLVEDSAVAIVTTDLMGRLTYVNKALADLFGYSILEMSDRAFKDFLHPDGKGRLVRLFLKVIVLRRQPRKFEFRALRKDGAVLHLICKLTRLGTAGKTMGARSEWSLYLQYSLCNLQDRGIVVNQKDGSSFAGQETASSIDE